MGFLDDRRRGLETQFAAVNAREFRHRSKAFLKAGLWAAHELGKAEQAAQDYARDILRHLSGARGDKRALGKLVGDLRGRVDKKQVLDKLAEFTPRAV